MSADYQPGTVAVATVRGVEAVRVFRSDRMGGWHLPVTVEGYRWHEDYDVTDVRPLVVLDLDGIDLVQLRHSLARWKSWSSMTSEQAMLERVLAQIEAQTKPPRIPEPALWGVVEATGPTLPTRRWVHHEENRWVCDTGLCAYWDDLIDPTLIREGVES